MRNQKIRAGALAFLCAATLSVGSVSMPAFAQGPAGNTTTTTQTATVNPATIDFAKKGSITVNKYEFEGQPVTATGSTLTDTTIPTGAKALSGAEFKIYKVQAITNASDYENAIKQAQNTLPDQPNTNAWTEAGSGTTGTNGQVKVSDLNVGLYAVYETKAPEGYQTIKPYYVFLPTTYTTADKTATADQGLKAWNYDIQSFPKDAKDISVSKGIKDANKNVGDTVDYFVKSNIPALGNEGLVTWFEFKDYLETENAKITEENKKAINVQIVDDKGNVYQTMDSSYFTATVKDTTAAAEGLTKGVNDYQGAEGAIQYTNVTLNTKGLYYLTYWKQQNPDLKVQLNLPATAQSVASTDGKEVNDAAVRYSNALPNTGVKPYTPPTPPTPPTPGTPPTPPTPPENPNTPPNTPPGTPPPGSPNTPPPSTPPTPPTTEKPTNEVYTYWGKVKLTKQDAVDGTKLKDAEFQVYRCPNGIADANNPDNLISITDPTTKEVKKTWTTNADGVVEIDGLHVTDYADNLADVAKTKQTTQYCVVETKAPAGYELLTEPVTFTLSKNDHLTDPKVIETEKIIKDHKSNVFKLPNTGGAGVALLIAFGAAVAGFGVFAARRNSKKA